MKRDIQKPDIKAIFHGKIFKYYIKALADELSEKNPEYETIGINKISFLNFINCPIILGERIFAIKSKNYYHMTSREFRTFLTQLYTGNKESLSGLVFDIIDFDRNGEVTLLDTKLILRVFTAYDPSLNLTDTVVERITEGLFPNNNNIKFPSFHLEGSLFVSILISFIKKRIPIYLDNIDTLSIYDLQIIDEECKNNDEDDLLLAYLQEDCSPNINLPITIKMNNKFVTEGSKKVKSNLSHSQLKTKTANRVDYVDLELVRKNISLHNFHKDLLFKHFIYEGYLYKKRKSGRMKKYWIGLINRDLFYFKDESKEDFKGFHHLSGFFINSIEEWLIENKTFFSFTLVGFNKSRSYYSLSETKVATWIKYINNNLARRDVFEHYEFGETIGTGTFGQVRLCTSKTSSEEVAIKLISKNGLEHEHQLRIYKEIEFLKICNHKNIVRFIDKFEDINYFYIITEYLERSLGSYITTDSILNESYIKQLFRQIAEGVHYLHENNIIHRDLKHENILVNSQGDVKIMDLGLSTFVTSNQKLSDGCGTLFFVAPEILLHQDHDYQVDVWSLGILLFYMIFRNFPYIGNMKKVRNDIINSEIKIPKQILSKDVYDVLSRSLIKDRRKRIKMKDLINHAWFK
jgi:hypothetical protein